MAPSLTSPPATSSTRDETATVMSGSASFSSAAICKDDPSVRILSSGSMSVSGADAGAHQPDSVINTVVPTNGNRARTDSSIARHHKLGRSSPAPDAIEHTNSRRRSAAPPTESYSQANAFEALALEKQSLELHAEKIRLAQARNALEAQVLELDVAMRKGAGGSIDGLTKYRGSPSVGSTNESEDAILRVQRGPGHWPMRSYRESATLQSLVPTASSTRGSSSAGLQTGHASNHARISNHKFGSPVSPHSLSRASFPAMADSYGAHAETEVASGLGAVGLKTTHESVGGDGSTGMIPAQGGPFTSVAI